MDKTVPPYLRIHTEDPPSVVRPEVEAAAWLEPLCSAFEQTTGWALRYIKQAVNESDLDSVWTAPVDPGVGTAPGHLRVEVSSNSNDRLPAAMELAGAGKLADALAGVLSELVQTQHVLWQREAELAAGVPVVAPPQGEQHLAARLEATLRSGAEAINCQAAGLYLLDADTTVLKLRSAWGLPLQRLLDPPRPLDSALADLEALLGHAVVLDEAQAQRAWNPPEQFGAAVCVPISTPTVPLGTLWAFSVEPRTFSEAHTGMLEVIAGRIASDLEREMLIQEQDNASESSQSIAAGARWQQHQLPAVAPLITGWDVAGWCAFSGRLGGNLYDWWLLPDGRLAVAVGDALQGGIDAALAASTLRAALRATTQYEKSPARALEQVSDLIYGGSQGDQYAACAVAILDPPRGVIRYAQAGAPSILRIGQADHEALTIEAASIGIEPALAFDEAEITLAAGEALLLASDGLRAAQDLDGRPLAHAGLAAILQNADIKSAPAHELVAHLQQRVAAELPDQPDNDFAAVVLKPVAG